MSDTTAPLKTPRDLILWGASRFDQAGLFFGHGTENAIDEAAALVLYALDLPQDSPSDSFDIEITPEQRERVVALLQRRIDERLPAAYLIGETYFAGLSFYIDQHVLIPRSPMAELIEREFSPFTPERVDSILDLCCGGGCIAIACAHYFPEAKTDAVDISTQALAVTDINIERHSLQARVESIQSDLFSSLQGRSYDIIVTNPPYVSREEMAQLPPEYQHEPGLGLEAGEDGLDIVRLILQQAANHLNPGGIIVVEVGHSAAAVERCWPQVPFLWFEFARGGEGVFLLTAEQLSEYQSIFCGSD
jgi:ribosomal protein L3 glutamine methyltransferase